MIKAYYICDVQEKVRLKEWHRTLVAAANECKRLNAKHDAEEGRTMARYFCGDWGDVSVSMRMISRVGDWPVANDNFKSKGKVQTETLGGPYKTSSELRVEYIDSQQAEQGNKEAPEL